MSDRSYFAMRDRILGASRRPESARRTQELGQRAALTYFPLFKLMSAEANPALTKAHDTITVRVIADLDSCSFQFNPTGTAKFTEPCDIAKGGAGPSVGELQGRSGAQGHGGSGENRQRRADPCQRGQSRRHGRCGTHKGRLVSVVYGPIAAALVEMFPTRIRYTSMSLPYHIGNGWFGGLMPATAFAMIAQTGDVYYGLWYPIVIALATVVIGLFFVPETKARDIFEDGRA